MPWLGDLHPSDRDLLSRLRYEKPEPSESINDVMGIPPAVEFPPVVVDSQPLPAQDECAGCQELYEVGKGYDPGCNYGCGWSVRGRAPLKPPFCHERFCSETCFDNTNERRAESEYRHAHEG